MAADLANARRLLDWCREEQLSFNDNIQGTARSIPGIELAQRGSALEDQPVKDAAKV
jgi:hypothetical protein